MVGGVHEMEEAAATEQPAVKFTAVDYVLFSLMLLASIGIGVYSAIKNRGKANTQEYLLGGRTMSAAPVALSLLGGWISALSVLGTPTEVYFFGTQIATTLLGCIPGCAFVCIVVLPIFHRLQLVSINEYMELRFGSPTLRKLGTLCLLLHEFLYMGFCLYAPTLALTTVTGLTTWWSTLILGTVCTFYITIGGVKAVVNADVLQTLLMFGGTLVVVVISCSDLGGVANVWSIADRGGRVQFFDLSTNPYERHTFLSTFVFGVYLAIKGIGFNQTTYQRFASVRTLQTSQCLVVFFLVGLYCLSTMFFFSGLVAFATYSDCDPLTSGKIEKTDQIIPYLVTDKLRHLTGLAGIYVAAVYGAVLSTISSSGNSVACIIWEDFLKHRPYFQRLDDASSTNVVKLLSTVAGVISMCLGLVVGKLGSLSHVTNSILSAISGPLCGIFISGILAPWINAPGAAVGFLTSFVFSVWVVIGKFLRGGGKPSRLPLSTEGCLENLASFVNTSVAAFTSLSLTNDTLTTATLAEDVLLTNATLTGAVLANTANTTTLQRSASKTVYEISYCYTGITAVFITFVVASLVSLCAGAVDPGDLREGVVNPSCARLYRRLWTVMSGRTTHKKTKETAVEQETFRMFTKPITDNLGSPS